MANEYQGEALIISDIQDRLSTIAELQYIDEDWGQLDVYAREMSPVKFPCALVDIVMTNWSNKGNRTQLGLSQVKIKFADMKLSNTSLKAPKRQKDKAYSYFDTLRRIKEALHGWSGNDAYSKLIRTTSVRAKREDGVRMYEVTFTTEHYDNGIAVQPQTFRIKPR